MAHREVETSGDELVRLVAEADRLSQGASVELIVKLRGEYHERKSSERQR